MRENKKAPGAKAKGFGLLYGILLLYSLSSVCSKIAAGYNFLSIPFFSFYGLAIAILAVYALLWQQVLKRLPLTTAFANKAILLVLGMVWGALLFDEPIRWNMIAGTAILVGGIWLVVGADE